MIRPFIHILALGLLACTICLPGLDQPVNIPLGGGVIQPYASSPQYDPTEPDFRRQMTADERLNGPRSVPAGGPGLLWNFSF